MVSYGLLTEIDVAGRGPGELVRPRGELAVRIRVQGPGWTRAEQVALYVNGTLVREDVIPGGTDAGLKWEATWRLAAPAHDVHVVAVATGPGVSAPYWPTAKPYQPTSTTFRPYVLGMSGAVFVDGDGSGTFDSALAYARRELAGTTDPRSLAARLARYDAAVATQAASLLRARDPAGFEATVDRCSGTPRHTSHADCGRIWTQRGLHTVRTPEFTISSEPAPSEVQYLEDRLYEFNAAATASPTAHGWRSSCATTTTGSWRGSAGTRGAAARKSASSGWKGTGADRDWGPGCSRRPSRKRGGVAAGTWS